MAFTYVTVTHTFETSSDTPASGYVEFEPVSQMHNVVTIVRTPRRAELDTTGSISISLAATDNVGTTPTGVTYRVTEYITDQDLLTYFVSVPAAEAPTADLQNLPPGAVGGGGGGGITTLRDATDYDDSVPPVDGQSVVWDGSTSKFHPETITPGAVSSVNGSTGAVTITLSGLGGQPIDTDLTTIAALAPADGTLMSRQSGAWAGRTTAQVKTDMALDQVNNTTDAAKPISTATTTALAAKASATVLTSIRTGNYTFVLADARVEQAYNSASAGTFTVPTDAAAAIAVGELIPLAQIGAGQLTIVGASGVTVNSRGGALKLAGQHAQAEIRKTAANTWRLYGDVVVS